MERSALRPTGGRSPSDDPFTAMRREMDRLFDDVGRSLGFTRPFWGEGAAPVRVDLHENDRVIEVHAELPGVDANDVELQLADNVLTIKGEKKQEKSEEGKGFHLNERSYGAFLRRIPLPAEVDEDKVEARFTNGVLTVTLPKLANEAARTRKIEIKSG